MTGQLLSRIEERARSLAPRVTEQETLCMLRFCLEHASLLERLSEQARDAVIDTAAKLVLSRREMAQPRAR